MTRRRRSLVFPIAAGVGALSIGSLAVYSCLVASTDGSGRDAAPASAPVTSEAASPRVVFEVHLPAFVIQLDDWAKSPTPENRRRLDEARDRLVSSAKLPIEVRGALAGLIDAAVGAAGAGEADADAAADTLTRSVGRLDDALARAGLDYWVDSDVLSSGGKRIVLMFSFEVKGVSQYRSGSRLLRARRLSRLDQLNWKYTLFGFTASGRRDAVVMVDKLDERLIASILPSLGTAAPPLPVDAGARGEAWVQPLSETARAIIAADLPAAVAAPTSDLVAPIIRRAELFSAIGERFLAERGVELAVQDTLTLPASWRDELEAIATEAQLLELSAIEKTLGSDASLHALEAAREPIARSVEMHEIQHQLDLDAELPMPAALEKLVGPIKSRRGVERSLAAHSRAELSAYLAELARSEVPRVVLVQLLGFAIDQGMWGSPESFAALVVFEQLGRALSLGADPVVADGKIDRAAVAAWFAKLETKTPEAVSAAARSLWARLFSRELAALERV